MSLRPRELRAKRSSQNPLEKIRDLLSERVRAKLSAGFCEPALKLAAPVCGFDSNEPASQMLRANAQAVAQAQTKGRLIVIGRNVWQPR